ncbi:MAG: polyphosphate:AMP phosphotransferase, partial [Rhodocyclaceae bacterium]|nr:polyphosphate:AMP phosphotransferase [Rhodocyclaceae bacterium]
MSLFESAELGHTVDDASYAKRVTKLRAELLDVQYAIKEAAAFPILILINGLDGAGKGETVHLLNEWMDPRHIETHAFPPPNDEEKQRPRMWRFWRALPPKGKIGIMFGNWYTDPIVAQASGGGKKAVLAERLDEILHFEHMLASEGVVLVKYWFHLSKQGQKKRLNRLEANPKTAWRVTKHDWKLYKRYDKFVGVAEHVLRETSTSDAPWHVVDGSDDNYRALAVGEHLLSVMKKQLAALQRVAKKVTTPAKAKSAHRLPALDSRNLLNSLDMSQTLTNSKYEHELEKWQGQLNLLSRHP